MISATPDLRISTQMSLVPIYAAWVWTTCQDCTWKRPWVVLAAYWLRVQCPNHYAIEPHKHLLL